MGLRELAAWDIWWANVKFEDTDEVKERPVIIVRPGEVYVVSVPVTSTPERIMWGEYDITMWKTAGFDHPSTARLSKIVHLERSAFSRKMGRLYAYDIANIQRLLAQWT